MRLEEEMLKGSPFLDCLCRDLTLLSPFISILRNVPRLALRGLEDRATSA